MGKIINIKIDVTKLDKDKLFKGEKGTYANFIVSENKDGENEYGQTHYVYEQQTQEEREAKTPKNYVGNGKEFVFNGTASVGTTPVGTTTADSDIPF